LVGTGIGASDNKEILLRELEGDTIGDSAILPLEEFGDKLGSDVGEEGILRGTGGDPELVELPGENGLKKINYQTNRMYISSQILYGRCRSKLDIMQPNR
jgi:hypothetical protein